MRISRIEGIQGLLGETRVTKNYPAAPVIHGALHLGVGGGQSVGILCRRNIRRMPRVRLRFWTWLWSPVSGGLIGNLSGYIPASALLPEKARALVRLPGLKPGSKVARHTVTQEFRSGPHFFLACGAALPFVGQPPQARLPASKVPPAKHHWYTVIKNTHGLVIFKVLGLRSQLPAKREVFRGNQP